MLDFILVSNGLSLVMFVLSLVCAYFALPFFVFATLFVCYLYLLGVSTIVLVGVSSVLFILTLSITRRYVFTFPIFFLMKSLGFLPTISKTEKEAIEAAKAGAAIAHIHVREEDGTPSRTIVDTPNKYK